MIRQVGGLLAKRWLIATFGSTVAVVVAVFFVVVMMMVVVTGGGAETATAPGGGCTTVGEPSDGDFPQYDTVQIERIQQIIAVGQEMAVDEYGWVIALAVGSQESTFRNLANDGQGGDLAPDQQDVATSLTYPNDGVGTDHGSVNVFQQQYPWWGTMPDLMDPPTAARKFYDALLDVPGWESMEVTVAAQQVQGSAFPFAYADDEPIARALVAEYGGVTYVPGGPTCAPVIVDPGGTAGIVNGWATPVDPATLTSGFGSRWGSFHYGVDLAGPIGTPVLAASDGTVIEAGPASGYGQWVTIQHDDGVVTIYGHIDTFIVSSGQRVVAGQQVATRGNEGHSTGPHLHFQIEVDGTPVDPVAFYAEKGAVLVPSGTP